MLKRFMIAGAILFGATALVISGGVIWIIVVELPSLCGNEVMQETASPDGTRRAIVFQRDCGATTGFSTQVSIIGASDDLPNEPGNTFIIDDHPSQRGVTLRWADDSTLVVVTSDRSGVHKAETEVSGVVVRYERP